ncbi:MAG: T9SS type A sorting domain-containing protein [Flavobacteriales bacterium]
MKKFLLVGSLFTATMANAQFVDAGFDFGTDASGWTQFSTNFGTPICDAGCGACGGGCGPQYGDFYVWFGGAGPANEEIGSVMQTVNIPAGDEASISFYAAVGNSGGLGEEEFVTVSLDGTLLFTITAADSTIYAEYTYFSFDISDFADGEDHDVIVAGFSENGSSIIFDTFDMMVDDNTLEVQNEMLNREMPISFYPNPANDQLNMRFNSRMEGDATAKIYDMSGKLVNSQYFSEVFNGTFGFDTQALENGMYSVLVENKGNLYTYRFAVAH